MNNSFVRRLIIGICIVLSLAGVCYIVFTAVDMYKNKSDESTDSYKGYKKQYPLDNVSVMIPEEYSVAFPENVDELQTGESLVIPYDEYYTWKESTYVGMLSVSKELNSNNMEPKAYMEACAIPTYEEYYTSLGFEVVARESGTVAGYDAAALTFEYTVVYEMGVSKNFTAYSVYINENGYMYTVTFVCESWDFETRKPTFIKISESINLSDVKPRSSESEK